MNYGVTILGKGRETVVFSDEKQRDFAVRLALGEEGGYEDATIFETDENPTHQSACEWFNS